MRTKTAYRPKTVENPAPNIPEVKIDGAEVEPVATHATDDIPAEPSAALAAEAEAVKADAALALKRQIEALQHSEQLQRQRAAQIAAQRPIGHADKLANWRAAGMSEADARFLDEHPAMVEHDGLTALAADEAARQGHARNTDAHRQATKQIFERHITSQTHAAQTAEPEFFRPAPPALPPVQSAMYSAPVSRVVPSGGYREPSPLQVHLSAEEKQVAAVSGISEVEYAKHKLRLEREKAAGERQR